MSHPETAQERTEAPTPRRRDKAHEQGRIPRSQELSGAVILLAGAGVLSWIGGTSLARFALELMTDTIGRSATASLDAVAATTLIRMVTQQSLLALAPFAVGVVSVALAVNLIQARGVASLHPIAVKWSHISPLTGLRRVFSVQAPFNLFKAVVKLLLLSAVAYLVLRGAWPELMSLSLQTPAAILRAAASLPLKLALITGLAFLVLSAIDYFFHVRQHERQLRMTKQEVVEEHRQTEGDPLVKSRLRAFARSLARRRMMQDVKTADVVVTNPTHIAIALRYDPTAAGAPLVLAMGMRKLAERIKKIALEATVPVIENPPLAQALLATATVGQPIPPALYAAVAEVLAFVYRRRGGHSYPVAGTGVAR